MTTSGHRILLGVASGWLAGAAIASESTWASSMFAALSVTLALWFFDALVIAAVAASKPNIAEFIGDDR